MGGGGEEGEGGWIKNNMVADVMNLVGGGDGVEEGERGKGGKVPRRGNA